ncbi:MAG: FkbM family methyltransferase [Candidatus Electrothrix sp. AR3]|nr:FkbM family methyltransferase [Candidatus Electrothrix sp. AR3]
MKNKYLLNSLFKFWNHYSAILPFNLNWQIKLGSHEKHFLSQNPLVVCDVGARGSASPELAPFYSHIYYHAFDADKKECDRLKSLSHPYHKMDIFPYYIGREDNQRIVFNLYKGKGYSSSYKPAKRFKDVFVGDDFAIEKEIETISCSLNGVYSKETLELPDYLQLDTQGSELDILHGAETIINNTCMVEIEVEFVEAYEGQPLFHDVLKFMTKKGFELLYLNRVFGQRTQVFKGQSRGQIIFGDALFGRREDCLNDFSKIRLVKYILLLINYGHIDFAYHLLILHQDINEEFPMLNYIISGKKHQWKLKRLLLSQLDKLILLLLHVRKYNQLSNDSDRSWPIR